MKGTMSRFDWINQVKEKIKEVAKTGLDFSATADCVLTVPDEFDINSLDQIHLWRFINILAEEQDATLGV